MSDLVTDPAEQNRSEADILVEVSGISKKFSRNLRSSLFYAVRDLGRELTGRSVVPELRQDEFWSLQDISFTLRRGESIGIIGPNGAGKSTLLKIITGIIKPTRGFVRTRGRVQALIELTTGMNLILSGRENIYSRAMLFGLSKAEVDAKFDEIVEFAELGRFIDMPMQNYSSGMRVKLGFAVAIHVKPDVLILDEVLAVGDQNFRAKAQLAMQQLLARNMALIFISHNMNHVMSITDQTLWIDRGEARKIGPSDVVCTDYINALKKSNVLTSPHTQNLHQFTVEKLCVKGEEMETGSVLTIGNDPSERRIPFDISLKCFKEMTSSKHFFNIFIIDGFNVKIAYHTFMDCISCDAGGVVTRRVEMDISDVLPGKYNVGVSVYQKDLVNVFGFNNGNLFKLDVRPMETGSGVWESGRTSPIQMNVKSDGAMLLPASLEAVSAPEA